MGNIADGYDFCHTIVHAFKRDETRPEILLLDQVNLWLRLDAC